MGEVDTEYGAAKVAKMHFPDKDIRIFEVRVVRTDDPTRSDYFETFKQIAMACDAIHAAFEKGELEGGTVCIDNVSDIYTWLNAWTEETAAKRTSTGRPQRLEWGKRNIMYRNLIWKVLSLPCHAIVTAQMQRVYGPRGEETNNWDARWLSAQPYWCDIVIRLDKLELGPEDVRYVATVEKCRFMRALNKRIRDITWDKLVKFLEEELGLKVAK